MINPLRSEAEAFRFVLGSLAYFAAIAVSAVINTWFGVAVFVVLTTALVVWWLRARRAEQPRRPAGRPAADIPDGPRLPADPGA